MGPVIVVVVSSAIALATAFLGRRRLPAPAVAVLLAIAGGTLAWGILLLQPSPSVGESVGSIVLLALLLPAHVRYVLGPFGPRR